jgi:hypothetical protein
VAIFTGASYATPTLTTETKYYVSVSGDEFCENAPGERRETGVEFNPAPQLVSPQNLIAVYSGYLFHFNVESTVEETQFTWERYTDGQHTSSGAGDISETLDNASTDPVEVKYIITMSSPEGCTAVDSISIRVNPLSEPPTLAGHPSDTAYCVCERDVRHKLSVQPESKDIDAKFSYQWCSNSRASIEGGEPVPGATDSIFYTPAGLPTGTYYYYCRVTSDYSPEPVYSKVATVQVEHDEAEIETLAVNNEDMPVQTGKSEYMAQCSEEYLILSAVASSKYASISVSVDGYEYVENLDDLKIPLTGDVTEISIRVVTCDEATVRQHTLIVTKSVEKLIYQRWDNSLAVYRNPNKNGGYSDIRGVRWYRHGQLIDTQTVTDMNSPADISVPEEWFIRLKNGESFEPYSAEVNLAGRWHRVCGAPVASGLAGKVLVYPNPVPAGEYLIVELPFVPINGKMNIVSFSGSIVRRDIPLKSSNSFINVSDLAPGIYILQIIDATERIQQTLIINN